MVFMRVISSNSISQSTTNRRSERRGEEMSFGLENWQINLILFFNDAHRLLLWLLMVYFSGYVQSLKLAHSCACAVLSKWWLFTPQELCWWWSRLPCVCMLECEWVSKYLKRHEIVYAWGLVLIVIKVSVSLSLSVHTVSWWAGIYGPCGSDCNPPHTHFLLITAGYFGIVL